MTLAIGLFVAFDDPGPFPRCTTVFVGVVLDDPLQEILLIALTAVAVIGFCWQLFLLAGDVVPAAALRVATDEFDSAVDGEVASI